MAILLSKKTRVLVQGITGKDGYHALTAMRTYHTNVLCGVAPYKGGTFIDEIPVFDSVREAKQSFPELNASLLVVPPRAVKEAAIEAIAAKIPLLVIVVERVPIQDTAIILAIAHEAGTRIIGPASIGILAPEIGRLGLLGGPTPEAIYRPGSVGIISRSGAMTNELSWIFHQQNMGQSTAIGIGGDFLIGTAYTELLEEFEKDPQTEATAIFGEVGGSHEQEIITGKESGIITKPVAIYIGGTSSAYLPSETPLGHAGALLDRGMGNIETKKEALQKAGILVADEVYDLPFLVKKAIHP